MATFATNTTMEDFAAAAAEGRPTIKIPAGAFQQLNANPQPIIISVDDDDWQDSLLFGTGSHDPAKRPIAGTRRVSRHRAKQTNPSPSSSTQSAVSTPNPPEESMDVDA